MQRHLQSTIGGRGILDGVRLSTVQYNGDGILEAGGHFQTQMDHSYHLGIFNT